MGDSRRVISDFNLLGTIGRGGFGSVVLAEDEDMRKYAIKAVKKSLILSIADGVEDVFKERKVMAMQNKFKCSLFFTFQDSGQGWPNSILFWQNTKT